MSFKTSYLALIMCVIGCGEPDTSLSPEERQVVDSLFSVYSGKEGKFLDSMCLIQRDTVFKYAVDSINKVRIKEIEQLINH